jgi:hypothetical protein
VASLLFPDDAPAAPAPLLQLPDERPPSLRPDPRADALGQTYQDITDYMAQQHQKGIDEGYWTGGGLLEGGHPTLKAFNSAADEYAQGLLLGTTSPSGKYLKAYHGSPHKFDAFDDKAIGTGEGAQAYGHGHYVAENEGVARSYRDALTADKITIDGRPASDIAGEKYRLGINETPTDVHNIADYISSYGPFARNMIEKRAPELLKPYDAMRASGQIQQGKGHMYEVKVNADPEKFLHWDRSLSEQHPDVQAALAKLPPPDDNLMFPITPKSLGRDYVSGYGSQALKDVGLPGIRYRDAGSRDAKGEPTHNAVVFDPATMEIIRRYGLAGLMLGGGGLLSPDKQEQ